MFAGDALMRAGFRLPHNTVLGASKGVATTRGDVQARLFEWVRA